MKVTNLPVKITVNLQEISNSLIYIHYVIIRNVFGSVLYSFICIFKFFSIAITEPEFNVVHIFRFCYNNGQKIPDPY